jgi:hypothetical protein
MTSSSVLITIDNQRAVPERIRLYCLLTDTVKQVCVRLVSVLHTDFSVELALWPAKHLLERRRTIGAINNDYFRGYVVDPAKFHLRARYQIMLNHHPTRVLFDTGAEMCMISKHTAENWQLRVDCTYAQTIASLNSNFQSLGRAFDVLVTIADYTFCCDFEVVDAAIDPIID